MICLVGEQQIPNYLPIKCFSSQIDEILLVYSEKTKERAKKLKGLLERNSYSVDFIKVNAYDYRRIFEKIGEKVSQRDKEFIVNFTGGTKIMSLAAFDLARELKDFLAIYLKSEKEFVMYEFAFKDGAISKIRTQPVRETVSLDEYLEMYLGRDYKITGFSKGKGGRFEKAVTDILRNECDEVKAGIKYGGIIDIDLAIRKANIVGIAEVKSGRNACKKRALEQLNTATDRAFLGIYIKKFLIVDRDDCSKNIKDLAEARSIKIIYLPSFQRDHKISDCDKERLIDEVRTW